MEGGGWGGEVEGRGGKDGGLVVSACASGCPRRLYVAIGVVVWCGSCTYCTKPISEVRRKCRVDYR